MKGRKDYRGMNVAAERIAYACLRLQEQFAKGMNRQVKKIPQRKLKSVLVAFCLLSGGFSMYVMLHGLFGKHRIPVMKVTPMKVPKVIDQAESKWKEMVSDEMYEGIQRYKYYMDSLGIPVRPGLLDSIKLLEQIYKNQQ